MRHLWSVFMYVCMCLPIVPLNVVVVQITKSYCLGSITVLLYDCYDDNNILSLFLMYLIIFRRESKEC